MSMESDLVLKKGAEVVLFFETVKERRNDLAHGTLSFAECGRDYSIDQLIDIKKETVLFLKGLLTGMKKYYDEQQYKL